MGDMDHDLQTELDKKLVNYETFKNSVIENIYEKQKECPIHGLTKHSSNYMSSASICIKCLKERRFGKNVQREQKTGPLKIGRRLMVVEAEWGMIG